MEQRTQKRLSAKQTRMLKLALDAAMLVLLVLMYKKQVISLEFHEIGGLALIGLFVIHHLVNAKWIGATTRRLFAKGTPGLVRARYIVDVLLLVAFLAIGVTGVFMSKVVFSLHVAGNFKALHYFASAMAIILTGVHLGLHADFIFGKLMRPGAHKVAKIAVAVLVAILVAFGGYSIATSSFVSFLAAPLQTASLAHGQPMPSGDVALDGSGERPSDLSQLPEFATEDGTQPSQNNESSAQPPQGDGNGAQPPQNDDSSAQPPQGDGNDALGGGAGMGQGGDSGGVEGRGGDRDEGGSTNAALLIAQYVSIITLFGAATNGIVKLFGKQKKSDADTELSEVIVTEAEPEQLTSGE